MQSYIQLFFITLNPHTNNFEYQTNEYIAPPIDPQKTVEQLTHEAYPDLLGRSLAQTTVWYFQEPSKLILTFMIYSDYFDFADATELNLSPAKESHWLALRPENYDDTTLVSHGLRHLSYHIIQQRPPKWMLASTIEKLAKLEKELTAELTELHQ
ncbi:MAG: hypothetical protein NVSMB37_7430 [Candidatus Saccharimonadales bacterium]